MTAMSLAPASPAPIPRRTPRDRADAREIERQLLVRYHQEGDLAAREELVERFCRWRGTWRFATRTPTSPSTTCCRSRAWA